MNKVIKDGKVAVLISPGFGAGWYTWNSEHKELLFNPKLVEMVEAGRRSEITEELITEELGIKNVYCGGADSLRVEWIDEGSSFTVEEYDGSESIRSISDLSIIA